MNWINRLPKLDTRFDEINGIWELFNKPLLILLVLALLGIVSGCSQKEFWVRTPEVKVKFIDKESKEEIPNLTVRAEWTVAKGLESMAAIKNLRLVTDDSGDILIPQAEMKSPYFEFVWISLWIDNPGYEGWNKTILKDRDLPEYKSEWYERKTTSNGSVSITLWLAPQTVKSTNKTRSFGSIS